MNLNLNVECKQRKRYRYNGDDFGSAVCLWVLQSPSSTSFPQLQGWCQGRGNRWGAVGFAKWWGVGVF
uniref:HDC08153 n=1 Tax=Drosophila melanogaster TaxID=7227 RepID=Q6ILX7_DROME|nr:TPA_inf: HDC08153 [Drosophila melanogaster]